MQSDQSKRLQNRVSHQEGIKPDQGVSGAIDHLMSNIYSTSIEA